MKTILSPRRDHYLKRVTIILLVVALTTGMAGCTTDGDHPPDATEITTWTELDAIREHPDGHYCLTKNLSSTPGTDGYDGYEDLAGPEANDGEGWKPIGTSDDPFTGTFDGGGHIITGLYINRHGEDNVGLFGYVEEGLVKNVGLVEVDVTGRNHTGALVGYNEKGTVGSDPGLPYSTYSTGNVTGSDTVGGLVGLNQLGTVSLSTSSVDVYHVSGECWRAGGLVGSNWGNVLLCSYNGSVTGDHEVGGLVGLNLGNVLSCKGEHTVDGQYFVGGGAGANVWPGNLDGNALHFTVNNKTSFMALSESSTGDAGLPDTAPQGSYAGILAGYHSGTATDNIVIGSAKGHTYVGGLAGYIDYGGTVDGCFVVATVEGTDYFDPLVGYTDPAANVTNSFNVTATQMMDIATFLGEGWDICAVAPGEVNTDCQWNIVNGQTYPFPSGKQLERYNLTISSTEGGKVTSPGEGTFTLYEGTVSSLVATPDAGYQFGGWTGDTTTIADPNDATTAITMNDNYSITATFRANEPIEIGGIFCMTGALAAMGELISQAALLAVEEINDDGGVLGADLYLVIEDSATSDTTAFEAYKKLVEVDGVQVIVGPMISGAVMSSGAYAEDMEVPMVSPSATSPLITVQPWTRWVLRTCTDDHFQGAVLADIIIDEGYETAAILVQDNPYGIGLELVVTDILEDAGVGIVESIRYDELKLDYLTELSAIKAANPDVIVQVGYHTDSAVVYVQAGDLGLDTIPWLVAEGVYGLEAETYPAAAEFMAGANLLGCTLAEEAEAPKYSAFKAAYEARWGESPGVYCDTVYDAVKLIALAIEEAGEYDGEEILYALYELGDGYSGTSGTITWDANGDRLGATYGVWDYVETAPGEYEYQILYHISF